MINMTKYPTFERKKQYYDIQDKTDYIVFTRSTLIANGDHMLVLRENWFCFKFGPEISKLQ